jgi:invasion protein IalB
MIRFAQGVGGLQVLTLFACAVVCYEGTASATGAQAEDSPVVEQSGVYGKWTLFCKPSPSLASDCALAQVVQDEAQDSTKVRMSVSFDEKWDLLFKIKVEPRPVQSEGIGLLIDGVQSAVLLPKSCDLTGCSATFYPSTTMLARVLRGSELDAQFRTDPRIGVSLGLELHKLHEALTAMRKQLPFRSGGDDWVASSNSLKEYKVGLVSLSDLPRDQMLNAQALNAATTLASALISCDSQGITVGEPRPSPVKISVDGNFELVGYTESSRSALTQLAETMHRCGDQTFVTMVPDSNSRWSTTPSEIQEATVENFLQDQGVDRLLVAD